MRASHGADFGAQRLVDLPDVLSNVVRRFRVTREIMFNLWYLTDATGAIYSLRAHPYVAGGSEPEDLAFLRSRAHLDYLVAFSFPVPEVYHVKLVESMADGSVTERRVPVALLHALEVMGGPIVLFHDALNHLEARLPSPRPVTVGPQPLYCLTPLYVDDEMNVQPVVSAAAQQHSTGGASDVNTNFVRYCKAFLEERCGLTMSEAQLLILDPELGPLMDQAKRDWVKNDVSLSTDPDEFLLSRRFDAVEMQRIIALLSRFASEYAARAPRIRAYLRSIGHPLGA